MTGSQPSRTTRVLAALVGLAALLVGCTPSSGPSSGSTPDPTVTTPSASASATRDDPPVASFDATKHDRFTDLTSPDRQTPAASTARPQGFTSPPPGSGMDRYLGRTIAWKSCGSFQCATVVVPLDWDHPDGQAITLALKRRPATASRTGTLFLNPGGPGGSGREMLDNFDASAFPHDDVIGWDPRGTGGSTPVVCGTASQTDAYLGLDASPTTTAGWNALVTGVKAFAQQCRAGSGVLLDHISTIDTARDLDYLRHLVGDRKLTYLGVSYGTFLGAVYAELYPSRVGRLVLDSAVNITENDTVSQAMGFDRAFRAFAAWCATAGDECGLGTSAREVIDRTTTFLTRLSTHPLAVEGRTLTRSAAATGIAMYLYSGADGYKYLAGALSWAMSKGTGSYLLAASDYLNGRDPKTGRYSTMTYAFPAIGCLDGGDKGLSQVKEQYARDSREAPILGPAFGASAVCAYWTTRPAPQLRITAKGAAPILVLGVTGDPATPYQQAQWMARQLDSGVLLTWKGAGHSAWELGNECVHRAVTSYLVDGVVPRDGTTC